MSRFSKHRQKPKWIPKNGSLVLVTDSHIVEVGEIHDIKGERWVWVKHEDLPQPDNQWRIPVRDLVDMVLKGDWRIVKDGPIEPEKILKQYKFI